MQDSALSTLGSSLKPEPKEGSKIGSPILNDYPKIKTKEVQLPLTTWGIRRQIVTSLIIDTPLPFNAQPSPVLGEELLPPH